ncbi:hypothetical protein [Yoonia sp. BS5-3]|uniref:DUF2125 domain-containing protein n=1 Tax=Yoonia phaeophyticola TaxID=3137369 RepID=A0ABZ2V1U1_9RHOB
MIRTAIILSALAGPVAADMNVTRTECAGSWLRFTDLLIAPLSTLAYAADAEAEMQALLTIKVEMTPDGWCQIRPGEFAALADAELEDIQWRADGLDAFANGTGLPRRLQMRLTGSQEAVSDQISYVAFTLQHVPDQGLLILENLDIGHPEHRPIAISAVLGGAYFDDVGSAAMSFGGLNLQELVASIETTPDLIAELAPDLTRTMLEGAISGLSFAQLDRPDRRAVLDFAKALPDAVGTLDVELRSERGLGMIQLGIAQTKEGPEVVSFALSGATVSADWTPE